MPPHPHRAFALIAALALAGPPAFSEAATISLPVRPSHRDLMAMRHEAALRVPSPDEANAVTR